MMHLARGIFLSLLFLTVLTTTASAECAWVLWIEHTYYEYPIKGLPRTVRLGPEFAVPTYEACLRGARKRLEAFTSGTPRFSMPSDIKPGEAITQPPGTVMIFDLDENGYTATTRPTSDSSILSKYQCLPDTVNPRGAKGGGR